MFVVLVSGGIGVGDNTVIAVVGTDTPEEDWYVELLLEGAVLVSVCENSVFAVVGLDIIEVEN